MDRYKPPILVWVIVEIHCHLEPVGQLSIWISGRKPSNALALKDDVAVKLLGPVSGEEGERVVRVLKEQLGISGVTVVEKVAADD